jgi:hypothetical protein
MTDSHLEDTFYAILEETETQDKRILIFQQMEQVVVVPSGLEPFSMDAAL